MAQDDYYYEIQLTNKQLVFYFVAGAMVLIAAFLAGIWVGRSIESPTQEAQAPKPVRDERIVTEESPKPAGSPSAMANEPLTYAQRLESEKSDDALERSRSADMASPKETTSPARATEAGETITVRGERGPGAAKDSGKTPPAKESGKPVKEPTKAAATKTPTTKERLGSAKEAGKSPAGSPAASPKTSTEPTGKAASGMLTIQVGAFKDRAAAEAVVNRLKAKGYAAFVAAPEGSGGGLFNVRVGSFSTRADAERIHAKLRDEEKFKPFIVKQ